MSPKYAEAGNVRIRKADAIEAMIYRQGTVNASTIRLQGSAYIFGRDIEIRLVQTKPVTVAYIRDSLPAWYFIECDGPATGYDVRFGSPGVVAVIYDGPAVAGIVPVAQTPSLRVGTSRAVTISDMLHPICNDDLATYQAWYKNDPTIATPGCLLATGHKSNAVAGVFGVNFPTAIATPQPVFVNFTYQSPITAPGAPQTCTPVFFYFVANDIQGPTRLGTDSNSIKLGDLSCLTTPISVDFIINHNVTEVGAFFPCAEQESGPGSGVYCTLDMVVCSAVGIKSMPTSGGSSDVPIGVVRPNYPGTGYAYFDRGYQ